MNLRSSLSLVTFLVSLLLAARARADIVYTVVDLGTLGGTSSVATNVGTQGSNASGMIVGESTTSDKAEHAFLYVNGQMFDLNTLCDLSQSDFRVLVIAKSVSDSCLITGEGITNNGEKHAFMLTPIQVGGGRWSYACCQWVWIPQAARSEGDEAAGAGAMQGEIGWWWEENCGCYRWHGPPGKHPPCPREPPPCWGFPLPCPPPCHRPQPTPTPPGGRTPIPTPTPGQPTPSMPPRFNRWPTPTPTLPPAVYQSPTPTPTLPPAVYRSPNPSVSETPSVNYSPTPNIPVTSSYRTNPVSAEVTRTPYYSGKVTAGRSTSGTTGRRTHTTATPPEKTTSHTTTSTSRTHGSTAKTPAKTKPKPTPRKTQRSQVPS